MAYDVLLSKRAEARLDRSIAYITDVLCSPAAARRLIDSFDLALDSLKTNPPFFVVDKQTSEDLGRIVYRKKLGKYRLLFCVDEAKQQVLVFSFVHELQDAREFVRQDYADI